MTKKNENAFTMFKTVKAVCNANITIINANQGLLNVFNQFSAKLSLIDTIVQLQIRNQTGITIDKRNARFRLVDFADAAAGILRAYFDSVGNTGNFTMLNYTISHLRRVRDQLLLSHTQTIIDQLNTNQSNLTSFGVNAAYITNLTNVRNTFQQLSTAPTHARNTKSVATFELEQKLDELNLFVKNELDNLMKNTKLTHPTFYNTYKHARRIVNNGIRRRSLLYGSIEGNITEATNQQVIENAIVELLNTQTLVISDSLGDFIINDIPPATYTLKVTHPDYQTQNIENVMIIAGNTNNLNIVLHPIVHEQ